jgi:hypothetical protein
MALVSNPSIAKKKKKIFFKAFWLKTLKAFPAWQLPSLSAHRVVPCLNGRSVPLTPL